MADKNLFDRYLLALRKTSIDEKTEHTDRSALQALLQALADDSISGVSHLILKSPKAASFSVTSRTRRSAKTSTRF